MVSLASSARFDCTGFPPEDHAFCFNYTLNVEQCGNAFVYFANMGILSRLSDPQSSRSELSVGGRRETDEVRRMQRVGTLTVKFHIMTTFRIESMHHLGIFWNECG